MFAITAIFVASLSQTPVILPEETPYRQPWTLCVKRCPPPEPEENDE